MKIAVIYNLFAFFVFLFPGSWLTFTACLLIFNAIAYFEHRAEAETKKAVISVEKLKTTARYKRGSL